MDNTPPPSTKTTRPYKKIVELKRPRRAGDLATVQRRFAHQKFQWLDQVAKDFVNLPPSAVAILLCPLFNLDFQGGAWPAHDSLAEALGVSRSTIVRVLHKLVEREHLTSKRRGRDKPNIYRMNEPRCVNSDTSSPHDVSDLHLRCVRSDTRLSSKTTEHSQEGDALGVSVWGAPVAPPPSEDRFQELRGIWQRGHAEDNTADRGAFIEACRVARVEDILGGARAWFESAPDPYFLPTLSKWLDDRCWAKPPPTPKKRNSSSRHRNGKRDPMEVVLGLATYEDADGNRRNKDTDAIVKHAEAVR
jgi:hypothetical protein